MIIFTQIPNHYLNILPCVENRIKNQMFSEMKKNTFYEGSPQQIANQQDQRNKQSTKQIIWRSKRLIQQIENNKSLKSIKSINSSNSINGSETRKLTTKQKIQSSMKNIKNNPTIAEQLLYNQNEQGGAHKKKDYINVIQQVYAKSKRKKRVRREEQSSPEQKRRKKRPSFIQLGLNSQLQKQIVQRVGVMGSKNYINEDDINEKGRNRKDNKQLGRLYNEQVEQIEYKIQSNSSIPNSKKEIRKNNENNKSKQGDLSIIMGQQEGNQLYDIDLSSSSQSSSSQNKDESDGEDLKKMQNEIDREINNLKIESKKKISSGQKIQFKTRVASGQSSDEQKQSIKEHKNKGGAISFRQQYQNSPKFRQISIPTEQAGEGNVQGHIHHNDYGIGIGQNKIIELLDTIRRRIKYSPVVIDQVYYEHCIREDNNQMQIDNRFSKETKQRLELMKRIRNYVTENKKYNRYYHFNHSNQYRSRNINNSVLQHRYPFKFDHFGNKKQCNGNQIWKSPGVSPSREKFISLNSPLKNNQKWFQSAQDETKIINVDSKLRNLLMCRSADTFATLNSIPTHNRSKFNKNKRWNRNSSKSSSDYSQLNDIGPKSRLRPKHQAKLSLLQKKQSQRAIKQNQWNIIQQVRRKINENQEDL